MAKIAPSIAVVTDNFTFASLDEAIIAMETSVEGLFTADNNAWHVVRYTYSTGADIVDLRAVCPAICAPSSQYGLEGLVCYRAYKIYADYASVCKWVSEHLADVKKVTSENPWTLAYSSMLAIRKATNLGKRPSKTPSKTADKSADERTDAKAFRLLEDKVASLTKQTGDLKREKTAITKERDTALEQATAPLSASDVLAQARAILEQDETLALDFTQNLMTSFGHAFNVTEPTIDAQIRELLAA